MKWIAFQEKVFTLLGKNKTGNLDAKEFVAYQTKVFDMMDKSPTHKGMLGKEEFMFATGGASRH
jgi:hypothetical protein